MSYSVNEIEMLAMKAARGAGAYPAQAAHFGRAVVRHLAARRAEEGLIEALEALPEGPIQTLPIAMPDRAETLLQMSYGEAIAAPVARASLPARLTCSPELHAHLSKLAQRSYVPSSEASRQSGAGAGLSDND